MLVYQVLDHLGVAFLNWLKLRSSGMIESLGGLDIRMGSLSRGPRGTVICLD